MSEATHFTQGSWEVSCDRAVMSGVDDSLIADLDRSDRPDDEIKANAQLMAAAPQMYHTLRSIARFFTDADFRTEQERKAKIATDGNVSALDCLIEGAAQAIAKAEGRSCEHTKKAGE